MVGIFAIIAIIGQAIFAIVAIDFFAIFANNNDMNDLREKQRIWLSEKLAARGHGSRGELAKHLNVRNDAITRMTNVEAGKEIREISLQELMGMAEFFGESPPGLVDMLRTALQRVSDDSGADAAEQRPRSAPPRKFLRTSKHKFYVMEWRKFMVGDRVDGAARAAGMPTDEYQAFETYPINFTLAQIAALADEFGIRGDQFWFPPPKGKPAPITAGSATRKRAAK